jgi:hypothetical protein
VGEAQRTVGGRQVKCYTGLGLRGDDDPGGGSDPVERTTATTDTTDPPIVTSTTVTPHHGKTLQEQGEGVGDAQNKQEREIGSIGSNRSSSAWVEAANKPAPRTLGDLLAEPPAWVTTQLERSRTKPGLRKALAKTISSQVYGTHERWEEALPLLDAALVEVEDL